MFTGVSDLFGKIQCIGSRLLLFDFDIQIIDDHVVRCCTWFILFDLWLGGYWSSGFIDPGFRCWPCVWYWPVRDLGKLSDSVIFFFAWKRVVGHLCSELVSFSHRSLYLRYGIIVLNFTRVYIFCCWHISIVCLQLSSLLCFALRKSSYCDTTFSETLTYQVSFPVIAPAYYHFFL